MFQLIISYKGKEYKHEISTGSDLEKLLDNELMNREATNGFVDSTRKPTRVRYNYYLGNRNVVIQVICSLQDNGVIGSIDSIVVKYIKIGTYNVKVVYNDIELDDSYFENPLFDMLCKTHERREFVSLCDNYNGYSGSDLTTVKAKTVEIDESLGNSKVALFYVKQSYTYRTLNDTRVMQMRIKTEL